LEPTYVQQFAELCYLKTSSREMSQKNVVRSGLITLKVLYN